MSRADLTILLGGCLKKNSSNPVVLVVAAHPDDEVLGCGGTIARLSKEGSEVHVAFLADGVFSRTDETSPENLGLKKRQDAARKAMAILGAKSVCFGDFPDNQMDTVPLLKIIKKVESWVSEYQPDTVLTHFRGDLNIDHQRTFDAVLTACRPQAGHPVRTILCFEVPSSTEWQSPVGHDSFSPNWFVDISGYLDLKMKALEAYSEEMRDWPHPRSVCAIDALIKWRGATVGKEAAEAFVLVRSLI